MNPTDSIALTQQQIGAASQPKPKSTSDPVKARAAAEKFEAFFLSQFLDSMFAGVRTDGMFGGGNAENFYRSMMTQEYGKTIAAAGGVGIADAVYRSIIQIQEQEQKS